MPRVEQRIFRIEIVEAYLVKHILITLLVFSAVALQAQRSISIEPAEVHATGNVDDTDIEAYVTVTNTGSETLDLLWTRYEVDKPEVWWSWICDLRNCYEWNISKAPASRVNTLEPGESMEFQVHARAFGEAGFAQIDVDLYDAADTATVLGTVKATFEAGTTSTDEPDKLARIRLYPNPATDYFRVFQDSGITDIEVYSVVGKRLLHFRASRDGRYDVSRLPEGMYVVRLLEETGSVVKTVRLSKG